MTASKRAQMHESAEDPLPRRAVPKAGGGQPHDQAKPLRIGISMCLLGEPVRYDGGHKLDRFLTDVLGKYVEFVPVCPEVEIGLGTPREAIHLVELVGEIQLRRVSSL